MTPAEYGEQLATDAPPLTDAQTYTAARILTMPLTDTEAA